VPGRPIVVPCSFIQENGSQRSHKTLLIFVREYFKYNFVGLREHYFDILAGRRFPHFLLKPQYRFVGLDAINVVFFLLALVGVAGKKGNRTTVHLKKHAFRRRIR